MIAENQSLENFQEVIKGKKVVLFGANYLTMKFINNCMEDNKQVAYICDNNVVKHGQKILGIDIVSPNTLETENKSNIVVVLCEKKSNPQIVEQIDKGGGEGIIIFAAITVMSRHFSDRAAYFITHEKDFKEIQNYFCDDYSKNIWNKIREHFLYGIEDFSDIRSLETEYLPDILFTEYISNKEIIISAGVKDGKDTKKFCNFFGKRLTKLYAFEPIKIAYDESMENLYEYYEKGYPINLINCGLLDEEQEIEFIFNKKILGSSRIPNEMISSQTYKEYFGNWQKETILVRPLDSIIPQDEKVTYIKMDIEGSEIKALLGAKRIIQEHKPRLAICIYHNPKDYFEIPFLLKEFVPSYNFFLKHHEKDRAGTVLYAINKEYTIISNYNHIFQVSNSFGGTLISGWSKIETWGCWSNGNIAQLSFILFEEKEVFMNLKCHGFLRPTYFSIDINGVRIGEYTVEDESEISFPIKKDYLKEKDEVFPVVIRFNIKNPAMPEGDQRMLGIGLHSFYLSQVE